MRYRHWIQPASEGKWPSAVVCVDCVSQVTNTIEQLVRWNAICLRAKDGTYQRVAELAGEDGGHFLSRIGDVSRREPNLWVVSYQCVRVWALLGVWRAIEDGRVRTVEDSVAHARHTAKRERDYRKRLTDPLRSLGGAEAARLVSGNGGSLVTEDPPNILRGRFDDAPSVVTWVDGRNYGVELPATVEPGRPTAAFLADLIGRMLQLCREYQLSSLKATAGSQAMSAWRYGYFPGGVYVHTDSRASALEGESYFGGRCEALRLGVVPVPCWHLDFRSEYGWVCANKPLPTRLRDYRECHGAAQGLRVSPDTGVIADVTIETDEPAYPKRVDGDVIYPVGRYRTVLCEPELTDALQHGRVVSVHSVATYAVDYCLRDYARALYALRCREERHGTPGVDQWVKRLIVSLPGKLGQRAFRWVDAPEVIPPSPNGYFHGEGPNNTVIRYRSICGCVQRECYDGFAPDSVPACAAFVTSHGRMRLLGAIRCAGWPNVYYYDTDSLIVNAEGFRQLERSAYMTEPGLGQLTVRAVPKITEIRGVKYYVEDRRVVCAGLERGTIVDCGDGQHYARYISAIDQARQGRRPESIVLHCNYPQRREYAQGVVGPDGTVRPFRLPIKGVEE